jgi:signal transduction histidine kinase
MGALALIMALLILANMLWGYFTQKKAMEDELLEESRALGAMMTSVWDFASINKEAINTSSTGVYDYKGLHCSLVGKAVGVIFSKNSDYVFHFVNFSPRNPNALPDEFETRALNSFLNDGATEYYGPAEYNGEQYFRYTYAMPVKKSCLECHGEPKGEIDISGFPKEGWKIDDIAGAGSIIMPISISQRNMSNNLIQNALFSGSVILASVLMIYFAVSRLVISPMGRLQAGFRRVGKGDVDYRLDDPKSSPYNTREMASVFFSFNNMTLELSGLYHSLEDRVTQRTEELREANCELEVQRKHLRIVNERLQDESRYKTDFLAMVSHELRTPLTSILAFAELLRSTLDDEASDADEQLAKIISNSHHLLELINNLLDSARIESGKQAVQSDVVDLYDTVGAAIAVVRPMAIEKQIKLLSTSEKNVPLIESDPELISRVLQNLLSNAVKFTQESGTVKVSLDSDDKAHMVMISVSDTGIGISKEQQSVIFDRFVQSNMSINRTYGGSGLGLALCKEVVALLGGSISVESDVGKGSNFTVTLPWAPIEDGEGDVQNFAD